MVTVLVPSPDAIVAPFVAVQLYEAAPDTAGILALTEVFDLYTVAVVEIDDNEVCGTDIRSTLALVILPQEFVA
jgi:hypothetical protein